MEFVLYIDFIQFCIADADADAKLWPDTNEQTFSQGFSRLEDFVSIRTLIDGGEARTIAKVMNAKEVDLNSYDRAVQVPLKSNSKKILFFVPTDYEKVVFDVPACNLLITVFQGLISQDDEIQETLICIEENRLETSTCTIIKCDSELKPKYPLLELSEPI